MAEKEIPKEKVNKPEEKDEFELLRGLNQGALNSKIALTLQFGQIDSKLDGFYIYMLLMLAMGSLDLVFIFNLRTTAVDSKNAAQHPSVLPFIYFVYYAFRLVTFFIAWLAKRNRSMNKHQLALRFLKYCMAALVLLTIYELKTMWDNYELIDRLYSVVKMNKELEAKAGPEAAARFNEEVRAQGLNFSEQDYQVLTAHITESIKHTLLTSLTGLATLLFIFVQAKEIEYLLAKRNLIMKEIPHSGHAKSN